MKKLMLVSISFCCFTSHGQYDKFWESNFEKSIKGDSIIFESSSSEHMNYFTQEMTSSTYYFGNISLGDLNDLAYSSLKMTQIVRIHNESNCGNYFVYLNGNLLFDYEIQENAVQGVGKCYYLCFECPIVSIGLFSNGKLNGPLLVFDKEGNILEIQNYKNGKYKGHLYHYLAKTKVALKEGNKKAKGNYSLKDKIND